jgi:hypothetical protein
MGFLWIGCQSNIDSTTDPIVDPKVEIVNGLMNRVEKSGGSLMLGCYDLELPFGVVDDRGTVYQIASEEDLEKVQMNFEKVILDFKYPMTLINDKGHFEVVNNIKEFTELFAECTPDIEIGKLFNAYHISYDNSCYELQFPVNIIDRENQKLIITDLGSFNGALASEEFQFDFPITLRDELGQNINVINEVELITKLVNCGKFPGGGIDTSASQSLFYCYEADYPLQIELINNEVISVQNESELIEHLIKDEFISFVYPFELSDAKGTTIVINSEDELVSLMNGCLALILQDQSLFVLLDGSREINTFPVCYDIQFPIQGYISYIGSQDSILVSYTNLASLENGLIGNIDKASCVYPLDVKIRSTGEINTITSIIDLLTIIQECD